MSSEEALRAHYEATNRQDWGTAMDGYDDDVVLFVPRGGPDAGSYYGKEAVGRWFGDWMRTFDRSVRFDELEIEKGEDALAMHGRMTARGAESGLELTEEWHWAYWFRQGKIVRVEIHRSLEDARAAAGVEVA